MKEFYEMGKCLSWLVLVLLLTSSWIACSRRQVITMKQHSSHGSYHSKAVWTSRNHRKADEPVSVSRQSWTQSQSQSSSPHQRLAETGPLLTSNTHGFSDRDSKVSVDAMGQQVRERGQKIFDSTFTKLDSINRSIDLLESKNLFPSDLVDIIHDVHGQKLSVRSRETVRLTELILERLEELGPACNAIELSQCLTGLAKLGIKCHDKMSRGLKRHDSVSKRSDVLPSFVEILPQRLMKMDDIMLANTLWAMGKIGLLWDSLPLKVQSAICNAIVAQAAEKFSAYATSNTIHGLSNMRANWYTLPQYVTETILALLEANLHELKELETSNCISGMGRLGVRWTDLPSRLHGLLGEAFCRNLKQLNAKGLAMSVHGLGRMQAKFANLPIAFRHSLLDSIKRISGVINAQEVANILHGLGKMAASLDAKNGAGSIPHKIRGVLLEALHREAWQMSAQGISNSIWGCMQMNCKWSDFSRPLQRNLLHAISREVLRMEEQEIANSLYALGSMSCRLDVHNNTLVALLQMLEEKVVYMPTIGLTMSLSGLGKMSLKWSSLSPSLSKRIESAVVKALENSNEANLGLILGALVDVEAHWDFLSPTVQTAIREGIARSFWKVTTSNDDSSRTPKVQVNASQIVLHLLTKDLDHHRPEVKRKYSPLDLLHAKEENEVEDLFRDVHLPHRVSTVQSISTSYLSEIPSSTAAALLLSLPQDQNIPSAASSTREQRSSYSRSPKPSSAPSSSALAGFRKLSEVKAGDAALGDHYIHPLSKLGVKWSDLDFSSKLVLKRSLESVLFSLSEQGVVNSINALANMGVEWTELSASLRSGALTALERVCADMGEQGVSVTFLALSKLRVDWSQDLPESLRAHLRQAIARQTTLSEHALSNLLYGLGKLGRPWDDLHPDVRHVLKAALVVGHVRNNCTSLGVTNSLYGLAHMQTNWQNLSSSVRLALMKDVQRTVGDATDSQFSSMLSSFSKLGVSWVSLPADLQLTLVDEVKKRLDRMSEFHLSNVLFALGGMGLNWVDLRKPLRDKVVDALLRLTSTEDLVGALAFPKPSVDSTPSHSSFPAFTFSRDLSIPSILGQGLRAQGLSMVLLGLSKMNVIWVLLPMTLQSSLLAIFLLQLPEMSSGQIAHSIYALGEMGLRWESISDTLRRRLLSSIARTVWVGNNIQDISVSLRALGIFGLRLQDADRSGVPFSRTLFRAIDVVLRQGNAAQISNILEGLALTETGWTMLPHRTRKSMVDCITKLFPHPQFSLENKRSTFASARRTEAVTDGDSYSGLIPYLSDAQALSSIMYSISLLTFDAPQVMLQTDMLRVHLSLLHHTSQLTATALTDAEKEKMLIYIHVLQTMIPDEATSFELSTRPFWLSIKTMEGDRPFSKLQHSVISAVKSALKVRDDELEVLDEYSAFDGAFPVDATVFEGTTPVAFVEVDGPHHYHNNGELRRKDLLKEALYRRKHPCASFTRVRYDQVDNLGSTYVGREVANFITISKHCCSIEDLEESECVHNAGCHTMQPSVDVGWSARQAQRELVNALDYANRNHKRHAHFTSPFIDFAFADSEEDNS
eukprot:gene3367-3691_t